MATDSRRFNVKVIGRNETSFVGTIMYLQERLVQVKGDCNWSVSIGTGIDDVMKNNDQGIDLEQIMSVGGLYASLWTNEYDRMHLVSFVYENISEEHVKCILNFIASMNLPFVSIEKQEVANC